MPRNGSGVMSWPPNTNAVSTQTVASAPYNAFLADLLSDLNAARPITAGGTGGVTAIGGNDALNTQSTAIASAATTDLSTANGVLVNITGTTAITSFGTAPAGAERVLIFAGALTLTYNAASLILPTAANITTVAGDVVTMRSLGGGNWKCVDYLTADGRSLSNALTAPNITGTETVSLSGVQAIGVSGGPVANSSAMLINSPNNGGAASFLSFNRTSVFAANFGIDTDNTLKIGGWSMGANAYRIMHEGLASGTFSGTYNFTGTIQKNGVALPVTKIFESPQQVMTNNSLYTIAHGLGVQPKLYQVYLVCVTADQGYAVGTELEGPKSNYTGSSTNWNGFVMYPDATNLTVLTGQGIQMMNQGRTSVVNLTNASWKIFVRAWA